MQLSVSLFGFIHETQNVNPWTVQDFCRGKFTMANFFFFLILAINEETLWEKVTYLLLYSLL